MNHNVISINKINDFLFSIRKFISIYYRHRDGNLKRYVIMEVIIQGVILLLVSINILYTNLWKLFENFKSILRVPRFHYTKHYFRLSVTGIITLVNKQNKTKQKIGRLLDRFLRFIYRWTIVLCVYLRKTNKMRRCQLL